MARKDDVTTPSSLPTPVSVKIGFISAIGILLLVVVFHRTDQEKHQRELAQAQLQTHLDEWKGEVFTTLHQKCRLTDDASHLFYETFTRTEMLAKLHHTVTVKSERDVQLWACDNGIRYWSLRDKLPDGFLKDYAALIPDQPRQ